MTYAEWVDLLRAFEGGAHDESVIALLGSARLVLSAGMGERVYRRLTDAFELRVRRISTALQQRLNRGSDPVAFGAAIVTARHELGTLARFVAAPCWPPDAAKMMRDSLDGFARKTHEALVESARNRERFDQGMQLSLVRKTPLSVPWPQPEQPPQKKSFFGGAPASPPPAGSRRIIV
jgi:hypothetical protein